jgi:hypothetical protein
MTDWTRHDEIRKRLERRWQRGELLAQLMDPAPDDALRIPLKHPTATQLTHRFDEARTWIEHITGHARKADEIPYTVEWHEFNHRTLGRNRLPVALVFPTLAHTLAYLNKTDEAQAFVRLAEQITERFPSLGPLLAAKPLDVLAHRTVWPELLAILAWMIDHPRPGIYLRQLEIPGVDTKFIEVRKAWIDRLLTAVLPPSAIDDSARGAAAFESRFGFRSKPARIRFRLLDPALYIQGLADLEIPACDMKSLTIRPKTVFIVENDINGLAFPDVPHALVIFGLGYGLSALSDITWLNHTALWYWGDLDTHGFAMLDQLRAAFPQTRSFLMDKDTLLSHQPLWGVEPSPTHRDLPRLTPAESAVYDALRHHRHAPSLRLEQERIAFAHVRRRVQDIQNL